MSTPIENVRVIRLYWAAANVARLTGNLAVDLPTLSKLARPLADAMRAMRELVAVAGTNPLTRAEVFASSSVFEQALSGEPATVTRTLLDLHSNMRQSVIAASIWALLSDADGAMRTPRQIMLDGIWDAGSGGLFTSRDPSGVTSWLRSASVAAGAINGTIAGDQDPGVVAAALRIFRDLAVPVIWLESASGFRAFEKLDSRLATTVWSRGQVSDLAARMTLKALSASASGRVSGDLAKLAALALTSFPTGDGSKIPTAPPAKRPWYKRGELASAAFIGIVGGAAVGSRRPRA